MMATNARLRPVSRETMKRRYIHECAEAVRSYVLRQLEDDRLMDLLGGKSILKKLRSTDSRKRRRRYCFVCKQDVDDAKGCFIKHCKMHLRDHTDRVLLVE